MQPIRCAPVLFFAPVFWREHFWSESARRWTGIAPSTALIDRPFVVLDVGLDANLGDILERACDDLGILPGPDMASSGSTRRAEIVRFGFVEEEADKNGIDAQVGYKWPSRLPVPKSDGQVDLVDGRDVTMRQLLAASELGLIRGDVTRPYIFPVVPQGAGQVITEIGSIAPELVRASLSSVRGMGGELIRVVQSSSGALSEADRYVSEHPIEVALGLGAFRRLKSKMWRRKDGPSGHVDEPL